MKRELSVPAVVAIIAAGVMLLGGLGWYMFGAGRGQYVDPKNAPVSAASANAADSSGAAGPSHGHAKPTFRRMGPSPAPGSGAGGGAVGTSASAD